MAFAATFEAVKVENSVSACHKTKYDVIHFGEYKFLTLLIERGMSIDSLLLKYGKIDWTYKQNWGCNGGIHPTRRG
jgi:hypothetical protein